MNTTGGAVSGFVCAVCSATVDVAEPFAWRCPAATPADPYHVLHIVTGDTVAVDAEGPVDGDTNPFSHYRSRAAWRAFADRSGLASDVCDRLIGEVAGDFRVTPFTMSDVLSDRLGVEVWVKDETVGVAGSHKARHLASILLHLRAAEELGMVSSRAPLAISSCGNAALAATTLAARVGWPIEVYVPTWMDDGFGRLLDELGAQVHRCERRSDDPPGDPAMLRFREAVAGGAIPFTVQGPENGYCLDGGRTIGWEIADQACAAGVVLDRIVVQVGGGALAACVGAGVGPTVRLDTVQAGGCAPLAAAWERLDGVDRPEQRWAEVMRPWPDPVSVADGILDDETYDWIADVSVMRASGGRPVVASEAQVLQAHRWATEAGFRASPTGSAGLAGLLAVRGELAAGASVAIVLSGVAR